jgi:hypothetical protein
MERHGAFNKGFNLIAEYNDYNIDNYQRVCPRGRDNLHSKCAVVIGCENIPAGAVSAIEGARGIHE